jgi:Zn-dependent membrane protease YugP
MPYFYGFDWSYIVYVLPALILAMWAQHNVSSTFKKYSRVPSTLTGADAARLVLRGYGLGDVGIGRINGQLTDHYDPRSNTISLSDAVHDVRTAAAVGVAAHEAGHAAQYAENYGPIKLRAAIVPITNIGSNLAMPLILLGLVLSFEPLAYLGVICFGAAGALIFQIISNVGMCMGLTPVIGLTLPFISYGGSSILSMFVMMGLVSGVHARPTRPIHERYIQPPRRDLRV